MPASPPLRSYPARRLRPRTTSPLKIQGPPLWKPGPGNKPIPVTDSPFRWVTHSPYDCLLHGGFVPHHRGLLSPPRPRPDLLIFHVDMDDDSRLSRIHSGGKRTLHGIISKPAQTLNITETLVTKRGMAGWPADGIDLLVIIRTQRLHAEGGRWCCGSSAPSLPFLIA